MPGPPVLNGPFTMPMFNGFVPRAIQPWIYLLIAFAFQMSGSLYSGAVAHFMGDTCLMREDALMIILCGVVGVNMPFPFLFRMKFRFTNRQLLLVASIVVGVCNLLVLTTESVPLLCIISYIAGFFKLCGTFECMSNIQLWMTPKRDFTVFFPLLYCVVLGNMSLSPWVSIQLTYIFQDWQVMNWMMAGAMFAIALFIYTCTHNFRFMKPLPFFAIDYLGCALWSAVMIEIIFLFNYGEFYNWWNGKPFRVVTLLLPFTLFFAIQRMRHIRHPYIQPSAWMYKRLLPLLGLFVIVEMISSTPKVLQNTFVSGVLHLGTMQTASLYLVEWLGSICGCLICLWWVKGLHQKYPRLLTIGCLALLMYEVMLYFMIQPGLDLASLYFPAWCRTFGVGIFFTALTVYLEDLMPFQHFFMGLTMLGMVRNGVVETMCSGIYSFNMRHHILENMTRGIPYEPLQAMMISLKQLFGATCIIATIVFLLFLLWDIQPVRSTIKKMPYWNVLGKEMRAALKFSKSKR